MIVSLQEWFHRQSGHRNEVCVIGGGPIGLDFAVRMARAGRSVLVLEGGGLETDARVQALHPLRECGRPFQGGNMPLRSFRTGANAEAVRVQALGGTSAIWSGRWKLPDLIDFEARRWLDVSGWPLRWKELESHADAVMRDYEVPGRVLRVPPIEAATTGVQTTLYHGQTHAVAFGQKHRAFLEASKHVTVVLHAHAVELFPEPGGGRVGEVIVKGVDGVSTRVSAQTFVVAAGGIENARLLLVSTRFGGKGPGNRSDHVGRGFMEHPRTRLGTFQPERAAVSAGLLARRALKRSHVFVRWALPPGRQKALAIANHALGLWPREPAKAWPSRMFAQPPEHDVYLLIEPLPHANSRVSLDPEKDALGVPNVRIQWEFSPGDEIGARKFVTAMIDLLMPRFGRFEIDDRALSPEAWSASGHHMGTTRMAASSDHGVVDADCRVFGLENLYVLGTSVFPVAGNADPTLLALALGRRLARHLAR